MISPWFKLNMVFTSKTMVFTGKTMVFTGQTSPFHRSNPGFHRSNRPFSPGQNLSAEAALGHPWAGHHGGRAALYVGDGVGGSTCRGGGMMVG